jgi:hypothetical protein
MHRYYALAFTCALAAGCTLVDDPAPGDSDTASSTTGASTSASGGGESTSADASFCNFPADIQPIFSAGCAFGGCHAGASAQLGLDLSDGAAHAALVGVPSAAQPATLLVAPGDPAASVLFLKVGAAPPVGARMPLGGTLTDTQLAMIEAWITAGAPDTATFACAGGAGGEVGAVDIEPPLALTIAVGELAQLSAAVTDSQGVPLPDLPLLWRSSDGLTLYADGQGGLLGVSPGDAWITATAGNVTSAPLALTVTPAAPPAATFEAARGLLVAGCALPGCHVDGVEPGDLRFDRPADQLWEKLVGQAAEQAPQLARVAPKDPKGSYLFMKIAVAEPPFGARMPLAQPPFSAASAQILLRWILAGAPLDG